MITPTRPNRDPEQKPSISVIELARMARVCVRTIDRWREAGRTPPRVRSYKKYLYRPADVYPWLEGLKRERGNQ